MKEKQILPYYDHDDKSLIRTIQHSARRRQMSPVAFAWRKMRNIVLAHWSYHCPLSGLRVKMNRARGVHIGSPCAIGKYCRIDNAYPEYVYLEDRVGIAEDVQIIAHCNPGSHFEDIIESSVAPVVIKEGAFIATGAIILRGVTIGKYSIVAAGTVVDKDVPDFTLVQGNPMKKVVTYASIMKKRLAAEQEQK